MRMQFWRNIRNRALRMGYQPRSEFVQSPWNGSHGTLVRSMDSTQIKVSLEICFGKNFMQQVQRVKKFSQVNGGHKRSY